MYTSEKNTKQLTVRGVVNPYGQPDCKISVIFFDDFPNLVGKQTNKVFKLKVA